MDSLCNHCQASVPPGASTCPDCGQARETPTQPEAVMPVIPGAPRRARTAAEELAATQFIELPPGALLPKPPAALSGAEPVADKPDRAGILAALGLGLLAGLLAILLIIGIARSRQSHSPPSATASPLEPRH